MAESFFVRWIRVVALAAMLVVLALPVAASAQGRAADLEDAALALRPGQYLWRDLDPGAGDVAIVVSIPTQVVYVYRGEQLVGVASVSTGKVGHRTPTGDYTVLQKRVFHRSNLYSNAPMPFMQRLTWTGIALHAGHNPGFPASHGCIRLPPAFAKLLFGATELGAPVAIVNGEWSVPRPDEDFPVIIADAGGLSAPAYANVTYATAAQVFEREPQPTMQPAVVNLRVSGDEKLVPEARLMLPD